MTSRTKAEAPATPVERLLAFRVSLTPELIFYLLVLAAAVALRFWDLGSRAYHHDESIHAQWSWKLLQGQYTHSPVFHGPLYYNAQALTFFITGASDYTGRISPALFGVAVVLAPLLLRRQLGRVGTGAAVAFLALSPTTVYFSRFFREDIFVALFILLMVVAMTRYVAEGRRRWLALLAFSFTGAVLTKEGAFITTGIFLLYLDLHFAAELVATIMQRRPGTPGRLGLLLERLFWVMVLAPIAWILAGLWPFLGRLRRALGQGRALARPGEALLVLGTLALPLLTPASRHYLLEPLGLIQEGRLAWDTSLRAGLSGGDISLLVGLFGLTLSISAFAGLNWRPRLWALLFVSSALIYLTLMTTYWSNLAGLVSGPWGSLDYWIEQQAEARGDQPWFYYYMLMPAYEFLPLVLAVGGVWWAAVRGNAFSRLLVIWAGGQWLALSYASEKMPWNNTHIAIPISLLAAWTVQRAWEHYRRPHLPAAALPALAAVALLGAGTLILVAWPPPVLEPVGARLAILAAGALLAAVAVYPLGRRGVPLALVTAVVGGLALFSLRTTVTASFVHADDPKDLLIYTQSSGELAQVARDIDALAGVSGKGYGLRIAVDTRDSFAWPWAWYLRDYRAVSYLDMSSANLSLADFDVILVNAADLSNVTSALGGDPGALYADPDRYPHRWWFDETYKLAFDVGNGICTARAGDCGPWRLAAWRHLFSRVIDGSWPRTWLRYIRDHDPGRPNGSVDAYAFFPAGFDRTAGTFRPVSQAPSGPGVDAEGRLTVGSWGSGPGRFLEPIDAAVGPDGSLYVVDRLSRTVQKFDPAGNFVTSVNLQEAGSTGGGPSPSDPWGLGVSADGRVVVADTFGYRIRVFDADLQPITSFGETPTGTDEPGPYELYGPRDAAFDEAGNIWVTDTGNDRLVIYTPEGEFVRTVGGPGSGPGQFDEPVGITMAADGTVFVADMWNARVQMLAPDGSPLGAFPVAGWGGQDVQDKPYLAALADGRVAVGLPLAGEVRIYTRDGEVSATLEAGSEGLDRPYGLATTPDGRLWVVEGGRHRLRLFEIP